MIPSELKNHDFIPVFSLHWTKKSYIFNKKLDFLYKKYHPLTEE